MFLFLEHFLDAVFFFFFKKKTLQSNFLNDIVH